MKKYKLTTQELTTHNGYQWRLGENKTTPGNGDLCGSGWLHYYHHPLLAILLNPMHASIQNPKLFECEAGGIHKNDMGLKGGCTELTLIQELTPTSITLTQRVAFGILVSQLVYKDSYYNKWANDWLENKDRSASAAESARSAARSARSAESARSAARSAAWSAAWSAAEAAARSARSAAESAESAAESARSAAESAESAAESARSAAWSAESADKFLEKLIECAEKCLEY